MSKLILTFRKLVLDMSNRFQADYEYLCNTEDNCIVTTDKSKAEESDAIIYDFFEQCWGDGEPHTVRKSLVLGLFHKCQITEF